MHKPNLNALWANFPDHIRYASLKDLYTTLGGAAARNISSEGFGVNGNTCASRLSVAFNRSGAPISAAIAAQVHADTLGTADDSRIIYRVAEFRRYLLHVFGPPTVDNVKPYDAQFRAKQGIIAFTVNWRNASGHIALFNRGTYREAHDNYSMFQEGLAHTSKGELWELP